MRRPLIHSKGMHLGSASLLRATMTKLLVASVEKREASLKKMMATVLKDKEKIEETIAELDRYKRDALQKTWEKVNGLVPSLDHFYYSLINVSFTAISVRFSPSSSQGISQSFNPLKGWTSRRVLKSKSV